MAETDLYLPLKAFMEGAGYSVKGEVNGCDLVGVREGEPALLVVCEMKLSRLLAEHKRRVGDPQIGGGYAKIPPDASRSGPGVAAYAGRTITFVSTGVRA